MSQKKNMYHNSKIYKIINTINDEIYIGSTVKQLSNRMAGHRTCAKDLTKKSRIYTTMRLNGITNYSIILVESFNCNNKEELRQREDYYIQLLKPHLNMNNAVRNKEECKADQKIYMKTYLQSKKGKATVKALLKNYHQFVRKPRTQNKRINDNWAKDKKIFYDLCSKIDLLLQQ